MTRTWFPTWMASVALLALSLLGITSFGMFLLPAALLMVGVVAVRARFWPDALGAVSGIGLVLFWPALVSWGVPRCQPGQVITLTPTEPGQSVSFTCTSTDYWLWVVSGLAFVAAGFAAYRVARRRGDRGTPKPSHAGERQAVAGLPPWVAGPVVAMGVLLILMFRGFLVSPVAMAIGSAVALVVGTIAATVYDPRWRRNAAVVALFIAVVLAAHLSHMWVLSRVLPPGAQGGPNVMPPG